HGNAVRFASSAREPSDRANTQTVVCFPKFDDVRDPLDNLLLSQIVYIKAQIATFPDVFPDVGRRRPVYYAALNENLRREIVLGDDGLFILGDDELLDLSASLSIMAGDRRRHHLAALYVGFAAARLTARSQRKEMKSVGVAHTRTHAVSQGVVLPHLPAWPTESQAFVSQSAWRHGPAPNRYCYFSNHGLVDTADANPAVCSDPETSPPEQWLNDDQIANRHQYAFGIGEHMYVVR
ncbi:cytochrome P450 2H2, partial [Colletotrichum musicola]